jgi:hypothetical protein
VLPGGLVARAFEPGEVVTLPGKVVVVVDGSSSVEDLVEHVARREVEWERREVLDDDQVVVLEDRLQFILRGCVVGVDAQSFEEMVHRSRTGYQGHVVAEELKCVDPLGGLYRNAIGAAQAKTHDSDAGHQSTLGHGKLDGSKE